MRCLGPSVRELELGSPGAAEGPGRCGVQCGLSRRPVRFGLDFDFDFDFSMREIWKSSLWNRLADRHDANGANYLGTNCLRSVLTTTIRQNRRDEGGTVGVWGARVSS